MATTIKNAKAELSGKMREIPMNSEPITITKPLTKHETDAAHALAVLIRPGVGSDIHQIAATMSRDAFRELLSGLVQARLNRTGIIDAEERQYAERLLELAATIRTV